MSDKYTGADYQEAVRQMVQRGVLYCASYLVHELAQQEQYMDDLLPVCVQDDYETPAWDEGWRIQDDEGMFTATRGEDTHELDFNVADEQDAWRELCEIENIEPFQTEAYEHWIVDDWLANKLQAKGEMVIHDFLGLTIWGRACTGQAILLDRVICDIYDELHRKAA